MHRSVPTILLAATATSFVLALSGCGGDDGSPAPQAFSVRDVQTRVRELTGATPVATRRRDATSLRFLGRTFGAAEVRRYSGVVIEVLPDRDAAQRRRRAATGPAIVRANVVVEGRPGSGSTALGEIAPVISSLGRPASAARVRPENWLCDRAGVDPDAAGGGTGSCLLRSRTVTVVDAGDELAWSGIVVSRPSVRTARSLVSTTPGRRGRVRASGEFVVVRATVASRTNERFTPQAPELVVAGRHHPADARSTLFDVAPYPFPLERAGDRGTAVWLYDVPRGTYGPRVAAALDFDATRLDGDARVADALQIARIRLPPAS